MKIRVISDVHGNIEALKAVLEDPRGSPADHTWCLGDTVGYGACPSECIELVRHSCDAVVSGNHDAGVAGMLSAERFNFAGARAVSWTAGQLCMEEAEWLGSLPLSISRLGFFLCHSYPVAPDSWIYVLSRETAVRSIESRPENISLIGHTHLPGCWTDDGNYSESPAGDFSRVRLLNAGSVGQPRDGDPRAAFLLIDPSEGTWEHCRVEYDIDRAAGRIRDADLPDVLWERLYAGR